MRFLVLTLALAALPAKATEYPLWDGEPIEEYAKRAGLPPTKAIDLGDGVTMDFVLIPAGKFVMGVPEPEPVDEESYRSKILAGQAVLAFGGVTFFFFLAVILVRILRKRQRPQYSLFWFLGMAVLAGTGLLGGLHWNHSAQAFAKARADYRAALVRYTTSWKNEKPAHEVTIGRPFYMGKFEVTQEQYDHVTGRNPSNFKGHRLPVEGVLWFDGQEFCEKASQITGKAIRLPSEAEWEYACRAGTRTAYSSGDDEASLDQVAWYSGNANRTHPVGEKAANAWGLHDMHGNVFEWCADIWHSDYNGAPIDGGVWGDSRSSFCFRVLRGGSWSSERAWYCRSAYRSDSPPGNNLGRHGFRAAMSPPP